MQEDLIFCPTCETPTEHAVVKSGHVLLVKCSGCGTVHPVQLERQRQRDVRVIVSRDEDTAVYHVKMDVKDRLSVGEEIMVDDGVNDVLMAEITSLEAKGRVETAEVGEVVTVWARATDDVTLKISVFRRGKTVSVKEKVPGEEVYQVGQTGVTDGVRYRVEKIKLRHGDFAERAMAKEILRIWGRRI